MIMKLNKNKSKASKIIIFVVILVFIIINLFYLFLYYQDNIDLLSRYLKMTHSEREIFGEYNIPFHTTISEVIKISTESDSLLLIAPRNHYDYYYYKLNYYLYPLTITNLTFDTEKQPESFLSELNTNLESEEPSFVLVINNQSFADIIPKSDPVFDQKYLPKIKNTLSDYNLEFSHMNQLLYVSQ